MEPSAKEHPPRRGMYHRAMSKVRRIVRFFSGRDSTKAPMPVDSPRTSSNEGRPDYKPNIGGGKPPTDASGDQTHPIQSLDPQGAPRDYAEKEECSSTEQTQSADAHPSNVAWQQRPLSTSPRALRPTSHAQTAIPDQNFSNHEGQHDLPSAPSDVDRRYIMRSRQWQIVTGADSAEVLVAPVTDDQHNDDIPEVSDDPEDAMTAMAEDVKIDGTFRRIYIRYDNDPEGRLAQTQCIMHDTGAGCSLTFASKLKELGLDYEPLRFRRPLRSLNGDPFYPIGKKQICFSYNGKGDKKHWTDVFVLADPPEEWEPAFDMLFGRDTIKKVKAIGWNHDVIGDTIHHLQTLDLTFPSLISSSPLVSICPRPESRTGIAVAEREAI